MNYKKGDTVELTVTDLAFGGNGIAKMENFVIFVEDTVPGDKILASFTKIKKQYAEARLQKIITPSTARIKPRCKHFDVCGGCGLQFLSYQDQLKWKEKMVRDSLEKLGGFEGIEVAPIIGCEDPWYYRNKMEYSFAPPGILGLHRKRSYADIFDLEECFLMSKRAVEILHAIKKWAIKNSIPAYDARRDEGLLKTLTIREGKNTGECMVNIVTNGRKFAHADEFKKFVEENFADVTSLYHTAVTIKKGFRTVVEEFHLAGKKTLKESLKVDSGGQGAQSSELSFEILPQAFFQPNTRQAQILYGKVLEFAGGAGQKTVLDLFCGTGTIGMFFAKQGATVTGIDMSESAIKVAIQNAAQNNLKNITFLCGDVLKLLHKAELIITDPPRAGIMPKSLEEILKLKTPNWIYVSCNPSTLARDLKIAAQAGYKIKKVQPVDMFPQTYHVETIVLLTA